MRRPDPSVGVVMLESFFTRLGFGMVTFALPLYGLSLGMSIAEVGILAGARAAAELAVKPLMGNLIERFGVRRGYLIAVTLRLLGAVLLFGATSPAATIAVRALQGAASAARDPASISLLAQRSRLHLGRAFAATIGARDMGTMLAGGLAGAILAATGGQFRVLWLVVVALAAIPLVAVFRSVEDAPAEDDHPSAADRPQAAGSGHGRAALRLIGGLGLLAGLTAHMTHGLFQVYAAEIAGLSVAQIGLIYSVSVLSLLVTGPIFGWAADRYGTGPLVPLRGLANAGSSLVYLAAPTFGGVLTGRLLDDWGKSAFRPMWGTLIAGAIRRSGARVGARLDALLSLGEALGPVLAGLLWDWWGVVAVFGVRAALGVVSELAIGRRLRTRPLQEPADLPAQRSGRMAQAQAGPRLG